MSIPVTKPFLPPQDEYKKLLDGIWQRNWLTNDGPILKELETQLQRQLRVNNLRYVANGTLALQIAIKALGLTGEIITTPFSYIATTSSIVWEGCSPVFADIDAKTWNIDPESIEAKITPQTSAILATHVYGNPCDVKAIKEIADRHNLKVIYDAAHCFGVEIDGESIFNFGDISTTSFHATKLFHTIEGGAVFSNSDELAEKVGFMRNFGHHGPEIFREVGVNGKNSEFHAAMGLCNLNYVADIIDRRKEVYRSYKQGLISTQIQFQKIAEFTKFNYSYVPLVLESEQAVLDVQSALENKGIFSRRYFYPTLDTADYLSESASTIPIAIDVAKRVLCLPQYFSITNGEVASIISVVNKVLK